MLPLTGTRVLDFTRHLPGPFATDLLRRLGAEVFKIEPPDGDPTRWLPPWKDDDGALFALLNGGKRSVAVDLKSEAGRAFVHRLTALCDVAVESYRPGIARTFQIDADTLRRINPALIYCSISGFGAQDRRSAHDLNFAALSGLLDLQRDGDGRPILPGTQVGDASGALFAALSIVAALDERKSSGQGRELDISLADATRAVMPSAESFYRGTGIRPDQYFLTGAFPGYAVYRTADGQYLAVAPLEQHFWAQFCQAIGHPELVSKQLDEGKRSAVFATIAGTIAMRTRQEWEGIFSKIDACVEPVLTIDEAHERFGDVSERHPLQKNFPMVSFPAEPLGASLSYAAEVAGLAQAEIEALEQSAGFRTRLKLKKLLIKVRTTLRR